MTCKDPPCLRWGVNPEEDLAQLFPAWCCPVVDLAAGDSELDSHDSLAGTDPYEPPVVPAIGGSPPDSDSEPSDTLGQLLVETVEAAGVQEGFPSATVFGNPPVDQWRG